MKAILLTAAVGISAALLTPVCKAVTILGTGTGALVGGDLTDPEDDGTAAGANYNADFFASNEASFGGGENAFNVFSNTVGGGNNKWCCGVLPFPQIVGAMNFEGIGQTIELTSFTLTGGNDAHQRDAQIWSIQGSTDTTTGLDGTWTTIYDHPTASNDWAAAFNQVNRYSPADGDTFLTSAGFNAFRLQVDQTGATSGAFWQLNEVEFFGNVIPVPEPSSATFFGLAGLGLVLRRRR